MEYTNRNQLQGLNTGDMLTAMKDTERTRVQNIARIVKVVLASMEPDYRPTFCTISLANLLEFLNRGSVDTLAMLYTEEFIVALADYFLQRRHSELSHKIMDGLYRVQDLCEPDELEKIQKGHEAVRKQGIPFDFSTIN